MKKEKYVEIDVSDWSEKDKKTLERLNKWWSKLTPKQRKEF